MIKGKPINTLEGRIKTIKLPVEGVQFKEGDDTKILFHGRDIDINLFIPAINKFLERNEYQFISGAAIEINTNTERQESIFDAVIVNPTLVVGNIKEIYISLPSGKLFATCKILSDKLENLNEKDLYLHIFAFVQTSNYSREEIQDIKVTKFVLCTDRRA